MGFLVPIALFGWIPVVLFLFMVLPPRRAVLTAFLVAWLFLPMAGYRLTGILPDYTKMSATIFGVLLGAVLFDANTLLKYRPRIWDLPFLLFCISPFFSSMLNGLGWWDGVSAVRERFLSFGLVFFIGRVYFNDLQGMRELAIGLFIGGLVYVPLCLFEIRFSPQLHRLFYGYHAHSFAQTYRMGGWRPTVFMQHGLMVGMWMAMTSLIGAWLWMTGTVRQIYGLPMSLLVPILMATALLCRSLNAMALLTLGLGALMCVHYLRSYIGVALLVALPIFYVGTRATNIWSGEGLVQIITDNISEDRAASLKFRFMNEDLLAAKAMQKPMFGWGGWGRARVFSEETGEDLTVTDGLWIIIFGNNGFFGLIPLMLMLLLPALLLRRYHPASQWSHPAIAPVAAIALISLLYMIDNLPNAMHNPIFLLAAGAGIGYGAAVQIRRPNAPFAWAFRGSRHMPGARSRPPQRPGDLRHIRA